MFDQKDVGALKRFSRIIRFMIPYGIVVNVFAFGWFCYMCVNKGSFMSKWAASLILFSFGLCVLFVGIVLLPGNRVLKKYLVKVQNENN